MRQIIRRIGILVLAAALALSMAADASADVYVNKAKPADWYDRELLTITFMDFYQNDAIVMQCGGAVMLIDGGAPKHWESMMAWLEEHGLAHVNILFNTHPHDDHVGAVTRMLESGRLTADVFISPFPREYKAEWQKKVVPVLEEKGIPYQQIMPRDTLVLGRVTLDGYRVKPDEDAGEDMAAEMVLYRWEEGKDTNGLSGILWVHYGDATILLPGDLTGEGEHWILDRYGAEGLKSDILKSPHHGIVRMVPDFLDAVDPDLTIVTNTQKSAGRQQLDARKRDSLCTSGGIIVLETDGKDWYVTQEKNAK